MKRPPQTRGLPERQMAVCQSKGSSLTTLKYCSFVIPPAKAIAPNRAKISNMSDATFAVCQIRI